MARVEFSINVSVEERWVNDFCSMLKAMEGYGNMGASGIIGIYADGDGDFHPKFNIDRPFTCTDGILKSKLTSRSIPDILFDAG